MGCGQEAPFDFSRDPCRTNLSYGETKVLLAGVCCQLQHTTSEVAHKAAFEEKRTWVDPQLRP